MSLEMANTCEHDTRRAAPPAATAQHISSTDCNAEPSHVTLGRKCVDVEHQQSQERDSDVACFDCSICLDLCRDPVVTMCGHLFCWSCLYYWLSLHSLFQECPVCKSDVQDRVIPLYGRGKPEYSAANRFPHTHIPCRPSAVRRSSAATSPPIARHVDPSGEIHRIAASASHSSAVLSGSAVASPSYIGGFFCSWRARCNAASLLARRRWPRSQRFNNEKEFALHWVFISVASVATACFFVC